MKIMILGFLLLTGVAAAFGLQDALSAVDARTNVVNAILSLDDAQTSLQRTLSDPLALRLDKVQAEQRQRLAAAQLQQARYQTMGDISSAYTQVLEAALQRDLAAMARDVQEQSLEIAQIRLRNGSATVLDVQDAENQLEDAINTLLIAEQGLALARSNLASLIGQPVSDIEPIPDVLLESLPSLEMVLVNLDQHPNVIEAANGAEVALVAVELLDPSYASQSQIDNARLQASQAQEFAREARRGLEVQAQSLHNQAVSAAESLSIRQAALSNALEREALERQRLNAGLIAEIQFKQSQLTTMQAQIAAVQAKHSYLSALLNLQASTMTPLAGLWSEISEGENSED